MITHVVHHGLIEIGIFNGISLKLVHQQRDAHQNPGAQ